MASRALHWFRRDLRVTDNTALHRAAREADELVPVYVLSDWSGSHLWTGPSRQEFLCGCLQSLALDLGKLGGRLIVRTGRAFEVLEQLIKDAGIDAVYYNRDPDPFGQSEEKSFEARCRTLGVPCHGCKDVVLHERDEILTNAGDPYRVYTPYSRKWLEAVKDPPLPRPARLRTPHGIASEEVPTLSHWGLSPSGVTLPQVGERAARGRLSRALRDRLPRYRAQRDFPARDGTSRLSQDLRFGTISIRTIHAKVSRRMEQSPTGDEREQFRTYLQELAWREFYMQLLHHFPEVLELEFNPSFRGLPWDQPGEALEAWKRGRTGFPIVDAGMRELAATGFMHNRVRMIVAMFFTKDLHLDWRLGEQFFMQSLIDGEIASNNGGWQWSAGTGADAAPYFRIQNPWSQTKRYDPEGDYIRRWVPELATFPAKSFLAPPPEGTSIHPDYPPPLVDHGRERTRTMAIFKRHLDAQS